MFTFEQREQYLTDAQDLWEKMKDLNNRSIRMKHDGYLKLFQLLVRVDFAAAMGISEPFDAILVDEAQVICPVCFVFKILFLSATE